MSNKDQMKAEIIAAEAALNTAKARLSAWESLAENNVFESLDKALGDIEDKLRDEAFQDCQDAGNCGASAYHQDFMVDGVKYRATLSVEYNRHDKTYYYIEEAELTHEVIA